MFFFTFLKDIFRILRSNESPAQIAIGFVLGMILGITPFWSLINLTIFATIIIININITAALLAYGIFSAVTYIGDPFFHQTGYWLLVHVPFLTPLWTLMYNTPILPFTDYNNTVYLSSFITSLLLIVPVYLGVTKFIIKYRTNYQSKVDSWKWVKLIKATKLYGWYQKVSFLES